MADDDEMEDELQWNDDIKWLSKIIAEGMVEILTAGLDKAQMSWAQELVRDLTDDIDASERTRH